MYDDQLTALWIGILVAAGMGLWPPWTAKGEFAGYRRLWHKNPADWRIDVTRLAIQWLIVAAVTFAAIKTAGPHHPPFVPTW